MRSLAAAKLTLSPEAFTADIETDLAAARALADQLRSSPPDGERTLAKFDRCFGLLGDARKVFAPMGQLHDRHPAPAPDEKLVAGPA